jgi:hypothetical protein
MSISTKRGDAGRSRLQLFYHLRERFLREPLPENFEAASYLPLAGEEE